MIHTWTYEFVPGYTLVHVDAFCDWLLTVYVWPTDPLTHKKLKMFAETFENRHSFGFYVNGRRNDVNDMTVTLHV